MSNPKFNEYTDMAHEAKILGGPDSMRWYYNRVGFESGWAARGMQDLTVVTLGTLFGVCAYGVSKSYLHMVKKYKEHKEEKALYKAWKEEQEQKKMLEEREGEKQQ